MSIQVIIKRQSIFMINKVYGALLGRQKGRNIELCTSFEMKMDPSPTNADLDEIDLEFLHTNIGQCKQFFNFFILIPK